MRLSFAELELDFEQQELRRGGAPVHVEPQVFDLLAHLMRNHDRIVGKDELFEVVWNGRFISEATLSSRINAARKAIGDDGERQALIKTVHKRGFRFIGTPEAAAEPASPAPAPPRAGGKPSVAVMPFANLSPEPDTEYFTYGLTEDIIRLLARNRWLEVLSRHSAAAFKGRDIPAQEIGATLGVRYLVQGSVVKRGDRVRIAADLVSAETGRQLWSESYDLTLDDLLGVQDAISQQIAATIEPELSRLEQEAAIRKPPSTMDAWDCYQRGLWCLWGFTVPGLKEAEALFGKTIELDPQFARAHGALAYVLLQQVFPAGRRQRAGLLETALRHARNAVALDDRDCMNLCVLGRVHCMLRDYAESTALLEECIRLNPSFAQGYYALGFTALWAGRADEALALAQRAIELSPYDPHLTSFHYVQALAHLRKGAPEAALACSGRAVRLKNAVHSAFMVHAAALGLADRLAEAGATAEELLRRMPDYHCGYVAEDLFYCDDAGFIARIAEGLRRAGLPDGPAAPRSH